MPLTPTRKLNVQVTFANMWEAIWAVALSTTLNAQVREIVGPMEYQVLMEDLASMRRPFAIVIVTPKEI